MPSTNTPRRIARPATAVDVLPNKRPTKQDLVLALLHNEGGAPLARIIEATGWQSHTVWAALSGLRRKGHAIVRNKIDDATHYAILPLSAQ